MQDFSLFSAPNSYNLYTNSFIIFSISVSRNLFYLPFEITLIIFLLCMNKNLIELAKLLNWIYSINFLKMEMYNFSRWLYARENFNFSLNFPRLLYKITRNKVKFIVKLSTFCRM